jgi:hypothetical protein
VGRAARSDGLEPLNDLQIPLWRSSYARPAEKTSTMTASAMSVSHAVITSRTRPLSISSPSIFVPYAKRAPMSSAFAASAAAKAEATAGFVLWRQQATDDVVTNFSKRRLDADSPCAIGRTVVNHVCLRVDDAGARSRAMRCYCRRGQLAFAPEL